MPASLFMYANPIARRHFLRQLSTGLSGVALAWMFDREARALASASPPSQRTLGLPHYAPKARRVLHICACGGVSHVDTYDYKPELARLDGQELTNKGKIDTFFGRPGRIMKSPFTFRRHGQSGLWMSELLPHLSQCVDDITFIYSMHAKTFNHTPATFLMNSGFSMNGFPCAGAWLSYGLGTENEDLPAYVVLPDPRQLPAGGSINWTSGFLPAVHQGVALRTSGDPITDLATPAAVSLAQRQASMTALDRMNREFAEANSDETALAARIRSYELAARMQLSVPET